MKPAQFVDAAKLIVGDGRGWQSAIARELGVNRSTVSRWLRGGTIPALVAKHLAIKQGGRDGEKRDA